MREYEKALAQSPEALAYLAQRGITLETAQAWHLGYREHAMSPNRERKQAGPTLVIPYINQDGDLADIKYRAMWDNPDPKYWRAGGGQSVLFGEHLLSQNGVLPTAGKSAESGNRTLYLCEGELDAITLHQHGFTPALSTTTGAQSFPERWYDVIKAYGADRVVIAYDSDVAGQKAAAHLVQKFEDMGAVSLVLPEGTKDANEYFKTHTAADFQELVKGTAPPEIEGIRTLTSVFDELETQLFLGEDAFVGAKSCFNELNAMINGGWWKGFVISVSGVAGTGKTSYVNQELLFAAQQGLPTWMLCLEMPEVMVLRKAIEHLYKVPMASMGLNDVQDARKKMEGIIPYYIGNRVQTLDQLMATARAAHKRDDLRMMAFDNLNFLVRSSANEAHRDGRE